MNKLLKIFILSFASVFLWSLPGRAAEPLVSADWLAANLDRPSLVIVDLRSALSQSGREDYEAAHVPGAVYSNYLSDGWRTTVEGIPGMLPPEADLEALIGRLGIGNDSHVVLVAGGGSSLSMGAATRVYWTFKVLGHDAVSILDGGHQAYRADPNRPLESGSVTPLPQVFAANFRPELLASQSQAKAAMTGEQALIDYRPPAQHRGEAKARVAKRRGTIPTAVNLPQSKLTRADGTFVDAEAMATFLADLGVEAAGDQVAFCNTGHWASLGWFMTGEVLGNKVAVLYDGSVAEWSADEALPMAVLAQPETQQ